MAKARVAINGFGRIGRSTLKAIITNPKLDVNVVAVNDLVDPENLAYLFKYDSIMGEFEGDVSYTDNAIIINGKEIRALAVTDPANLPWRDLGVDVVIESTGLFTDGDKAKAHLQAGAKKVIISAPAKNEDITLNLGVNEGEYDPEKHNIISNASCTTNCLTVMAKVIQENFGIREGMMTTVHSYTASQKLMDGPSKKDKRRGRAAALNIVPTSTGAAKSIGEVMPSLNGRMDGYAIRVPTPDVSILDLTVVTEKPVTVESANKAFQDASRNHLNGIVAYSEEPLVSTDYIGDPHSCVIDSKLTMVVGNNVLKAVGWYDNEWGFSNRLAELTEMVANKIPVAAA